MPSHPLETLYRRHRQGLFTLALSVTRRADSAEDAVHDAFARLCRLELPDDERQATAYVFRAVRNAAIDRVRKSNRTEDTAGESIFLAADRDGEHNPLRITADVERDRLLRAAVDGLDEPARAVVTMKVFGQLTFELIAATMGEPLSTVASRYRRALEKIRQEVETLV